LVALPADIKRYIFQYVPTWFHPVFRLVCKEIHRLLGPNAKEQGKRIWFTCNKDHGNYYPSLLLWLSEKGPRPNIRVSIDTDQGSSNLERNIDFPLARAAKRGDFEMVKTLVNRHYQNGFIFPRRVVKWAVIHDKAEMIGWMMLATGAETPRTDMNQECFPLMYIDAVYTQAARVGDCAKITELATRFPPTHASMRAAGKMGHVCVLKTIASVRYLGRLDYEFNTAAIEAVKRRHIHVLKWMVEKKIAISEYALAEAAKRHDKEAIEVIMQYPERAFGAGRHASVPFIDQGNIDMLSTFMQLKMGINWAHVVKTANDQESLPLLQFALERRHLVRTKATSQGGPWKWFIIHSNGYDSPFRPQEGPWVNKQLSNLDKDLYTNRVIPSNTGYY
jgi:hypothetical protein